MEDTVKFNIITKILIIFFGIVTIITAFLSVTFEGTTSTGSFYYDLRFGIIYFPSTSLEHGTAVSYNTFLHALFAVLFVIAYFLNFGYFKKEGISERRRKLDLYSALLMIVGFFGSYLSASLTTSLYEIPPTHITSYTRVNTILSGFTTGIILIVIVLIEYIVLEKSNLFISGKGGKAIDKRIEPSEVIRKPVVHCSACGNEIVDISGGFCSKCGAPIEEVTTKTMLEDKKFCSECGKEIKKSAKFCEHCSAKQ